MMFLTSDLLLGLYSTLLNDPMIHVVYMLLFYLALLLLTLSSFHSSDRSFQHSNSLMNK